MSEIIPLDINTPQVFSEILSRSVSPNISVPTISTSSITNRNRYLIQSNSTYFKIGDTLQLSGGNGTYNVEFDTSFVTYKNYLVKTFQTVEDTADPTCFRIDSELNYLFSLDYDGTKLLFQNNWGSKYVTNASGYLCFNYTAGGKLKVIKRYSYSTSTYTHTEVTGYAYANYYVKYVGGVLTLTATEGDGSVFTFYYSSMNVSIPFDFNPLLQKYVTNSRVDIAAYISNTIENIEAAYNNINSKFRINFYNTNGTKKTSDAGFVYANQLTAIGYDETTNYYADLMLSQISTKILNNTTYSKKLRYPSSVYKTFREGALKFVLKSNEVANGEIDMNTTPFVYFTCESDGTDYHPFMCMASFSVSDKPNRLLDICRPPGDGDGSYDSQKVTRDATLQLYLSKVPMLDYGTVVDITGSVYYNGSTVVDDSSGNTNNYHSSSLAYNFIEYYTENGNENTDGTRIYTSVTYNNYNYTSNSGIGIMVDGVSLYPVLNNTCNTAHKSAEITDVGHHVGRGMGLHYHGDGYGAKLTTYNKTNNLYLYNDHDYFGAKHPPIIGFGYDGIALYGIYNSEYSYMDGYNVSLDNFGGHTHGEYGYHYHSHTVQNNSSNNVDIGTPATVYKIHVLMKGTWKGNVNNIPSFWNPASGTHNQYAPQYSLSQRNKYVWGSAI